MTRRRVSQVLGQLAVASIALAIGIGLSLVVVALSGASASAAVEALLRGAFGSKDALLSTIVEMLPLILVALAWIVALSSGLFNVGMPGQMILGGIGAAVVALKIPLPPGIHLGVAVLGGAIGGMLWVGIATLLWAWRGVNEIISTLLLNFVAVEVLAWVLRGPLQEPGSPFFQTAPLPNGSTWPSLAPRAGLGADVFLVGFLVVAVAIVMRSTTFGLRLRLTAGNERAARRAGIATRTVRVTAMLWSGALAGVAGSSLVLSGQLHVLTDGFQGTYGLDGIAVALLAANSAIATVPAALLFAALIQGGGLMETEVGVPSSLVSVTAGVVIIAVATVGAFVRTKRIKFSPPGRRERVAQALHRRPATVSETGNGE